MNTLNIIPTEELAWAAGFFDGEGCVGLHVNNHKKRIQVSIAQSGSPELLERFINVVEVGKVRGPYGPYTPNQQPYYQYMAYGLEDAIKVFEAIGKFLCEDKRTAFESVLNREHTDTIQLTQTLGVAWSAGFLDGEGNFGFYIQGNNRGLVRISADQVSRDPLDRLADILGGKVRGPYSHSKNSAGKQDFYKWDCSTIEGVQKVISSVTPWLGEVKEEQANKALEDFQNRRPAKQGGTPRKTECIRGHDLTDPANLYIWSNGSRSCKICPKIRKMDNRRLKNEAL